MKRSPEALGREADHFLRKANDIMATARAERAATVRAHYKNLSYHGTWTVTAVNDDGRVRVVRAGLTYAAADRMAGEMRDRSTEQQIAEGWNFLPRLGARQQKHIGAAVTTPRSGRGPVPQ